MGHISWDRVTIVRYWTVCAFKGMKLQDRSVEWSQYRGRLGTNLTITQSINKASKIDTSAVPSGKLKRAYTPNNKRNDTETI